MMVHMINQNKDTRFNRLAHDSEMMNTDLMTTAAAVAAAAVTVNGDVNGYHYVNYDSAHDRDHVHHDHHDHDHDHDLLSVDAVACIA